MVFDRKFGLFELTLHPLIQPSSKAMIASVSGNWHLRSGHSRYDTIQRTRKFVYGMDSLGSSKTTHARLVSFTKQFGLRIIRSTDQTGKRRKHSSWSMAMYAGPLSLYLCVELDIFYRIWLLHSRMCGAIHGRKGRYRKQAQGIDLILLSGWKETRWDILWCWKRLF